MIMETSYMSEGIVLGNYWGGGKGTYSARKFTSDKSYNDIVQQNKDALEDGSLDSGMGYESLIGALIFIKETKYKEIDKETYHKHDVHEIFLGDLTEEEKYFLREVYNE